ncbi:MAG TPA: ribosome maturation factor RimP, partial [Kineosporiaceae bacterium]|nr:ribosome maturation factor RimP [Kineosporiaceae bacterium]
VMTASSQADGVRSLAGPAAASAGLVVESVTVTPAGRRRVLRVIVDLPDDAVGGVPMEAVATASKALSEALDDSTVMGGAPYVLEVSSPGVDRPLTERRHWLRARGRLVRATLADSSELTDRLGVVDDGGVLLGSVRVAWAQLRKGRIEIEFARPGGGDDSDDPDEIDEIDDEEQEV